MTTIAKRAKPAPKPDAKTAADKAEANRRRQAEFQARKHSQGHAEVRAIYAHIDDHPEIKKVAGVVIRRRQRSKP